MTYKSKHNFGAQIKRCRYVSQLGENLYQGMQGSLSIYIRVGNSDPESAQFLVNFVIRIRNPFFKADSDS